MLLSFKIRNFKSFLDEQVFSLDPVFAGSEFDPLTVAAVYGGNASGKSNLLDAISWARPASMSSKRFDRDDAPLRIPFKLTPEGAVRTSEASFEIRIGDTEYSYGFEVDDDAFIREWLYAYPHKRARMLFERAGADVEIGASVEGRKGIHAIATKVQPSRSMLSALDGLKVPEWSPVLEWFARTEVLGGGMWTAFDSAGHLADAIEQQPALIRLVRHADVGIRDIEIRERRMPPTTAELRVAEDLESELASLEERRKTLPDDESTVQRRIANIPAQIRRLRSGWVEREPVFYHGDSSYPLSLYEQSQGTLEFLTFMCGALRALQSGGLAIIDEIESSLHSRLVPRIIELFRNKESNPHGAQLVFTTHDTSLLGTSLGEPVLRRDEVWFVEKDGHGQSSLVPLSDFKPRKEGENRERQYLGGSYGAVPSVFIDSLVDAVRDCLGEDREVAPE